MRTRLVCLVALAVALALVTAACGDGLDAIDPPAAKVNGDNISQDELDQELEAMSGNAKFVAFLVSQNNSVRNEATGTYDVGFVGRVLSRQILLRLIHEAFVEKKLGPLTEADRELVQADVEREVGGPEILAEFAEPYRTLLLNRSAEVAKLQLSLSEQPIDDDAMREYYESTPELFRQTCSRHILFSVIDDTGSVDTESATAQSVELEAQANAAKARIDAGEDFAALAAELSKDSNNNQSGGELGCNGPGQFVPEFETVLDSLEPGQVSAPVQTQFGWHLIKVDTREPQPFEDVVDQIRQVLLGQAQEGFGAFVREELDAAKIEVNPRFGTYSKTAQPPGIVTPTPPTTLDVGGASSPGTDAGGVPAPTELGG